MSIPADVVRGLIADAVASAVVPLGGFPPIALKADLGGVQAVRGCSYIQTCTGGSIALILPPSPSDGDEVGVIVLCGSCNAGMGICGGTKNIMCSNLPLPLGCDSQQLYPPTGEPFILRFNAADDLWDFVAGIGG